MTPTTVPVTIAPEAAAYVAELGMQEPFQKMLDRIPQTVPGLHSVVVNLQEPHDLGDDPCVVFDVTRQDPQLDYNPTEK
jgi:hypothetical protein